MDQLKWVRRAGLLRRHDSSGGVAAALSLTTRAHRGTYELSELRSGHREIVS